MAIIYGLKVNLSVAMVAMVNHTAVKLNSHSIDHHEHSPLANASKIVEECEADIRNSSSVSQVNSLFLMVFVLNVIKIQIAFIER
jgi:hypothetical protein